MQYKKNLIEHNFLIFLILVSVISIIFYYQFYQYKYGEVLRYSFDFGRYDSKNFFESYVDKFNSGWHLFFTYKFFIFVLVKANILESYIYFQNIIFFISIILFYKALINFRFGKNTSIFASIVLTTNPFVLFWVQSFNHVSITISLLLVTLFFMSIYDRNLLSKILFIVFLILFLKVDGKVFFVFFFLTFYQFYWKNIERKKINLILLIIFSIFYIYYLNYYAAGLEPFNDVYFAKDVNLLGLFQFEKTKETIQIYNECLFTLNNSLQNHICAISKDFIYSFKVYLARFIHLTSWINLKLSLKYNIVAFSYVFFIYSGVILSLFLNRTNKINVNYKLSVSLIFGYFFSIFIMLPYVIRGDQKQTVYALILLIPIAVKGYLDLYVKKIKKK